MTPLAVSAVTLDAYGTLFEGGSDDLIAMLRDLLEEARADVRLEDALKRREELIAQLERKGFLRMRERDRWILTTLFREYGIDRDPEPYVDTLYETYFRVELYPDTLPCLEGLQEKGVKLAVVSNSDVDMMDRILREHGVADAFDAVVTSESAQAYKPAPPMFQAASRALGAAPGAVLHVGDSYTADVLGAKRAGMRAAWLTRPGGLPAPERPEHEPDVVVSSLTELPGLLG